MRHFFVLGLLLVAGSLFAFPQTFISVEGGANANAREGIAVAGGLSLGWELSERFSLGVRATYNHDMDTLSTIEEMALLRYNILLKGLFVQVEGGGSLYFSEDGWSQILPLGAACVGWRFGLGDKWYIEPMLRGGYPFIWGGSVGFGLRF